VPPPAPNQSTSSLPTARTPLAHWHAQHGARFDEIHSWQLPVAYSSEDQEVKAARTGLALADISFVAKMMARGSGVGELVESLTGEGQFSKQCHLHTDELLLIGGPSSRIRLDQLLSKAGKTAAVLQTDMTSALAAFWLFGPHTDETLRQVTHYDVAAMAPGSCTETGLAGVPAVLIRPQTPTVPSMQILVGWDVAEYVWEKLWQLGQIWNVSPLGIDGLDVLVNHGPK